MPKKSIQTLLYHCHRIFLFIQYLPIHSSFLLPLFQKLPEEEHIYRITETDLQGSLSLNSNVGVVISRIPFTHCQNVVKIIRVRYLSIHACIHALYVYSSLNLTRLHKIFSSDFHDPGYSCTTVTVVYTYCRIICGIINAFFISRF